MSTNPELSKFTSSELEEELNQRFEQSVKGLTSMSQDELYDIATACGEEYHEGIDCLPCEAWELYCGRRN